MNSAAIIQPVQKAGKHTGKNFGLNIPTDNRYNYVDESFVLNNLRRNCETVCGLAAPRTLNLIELSGELVENIASDLEFHLAIIARCRRHSNGFQSLGDAGDDTQDKVDETSLRYAWATEILEWTDCLKPTVDDGGQYSGGSEHSSDSQLTVWEANRITPSFEAFLLFVAHYVKTYVEHDRSVGKSMSEDCRLILPVIDEDIDGEWTEFNSADYVSSTALSRIACGMFPISCREETQVVSTYHNIIAEVEIATDSDGLDGAVQRLAESTRVLFSNQLNRRFAWGLTASSRTIHSYVFGPDDIWQSTEMDITSAEGRQAFISLLVSWSLCPIDRLGFDPSIRYIVDKRVGDPYLEIDVHAKNESTGLMHKHTYYSNECIGSADLLTGSRARYFAATSCPGMMNTPDLLVKNMWTTFNSDSDVPESSFLNTLHAEFDGFSEFSGRFSQLVTTGPVHFNQGGKLILDSTATAFAGLLTTTQEATNNSNAAQISSSSRARHHRRTVTKWAGNMISAAANPSQVVVAIADAMVAVHKQAALVVLRNCTSTANCVAEVEPNPATSVISAPAKRQRDNEAYDRPTKRMRSKANHPVP
ncbi:hypothetical protein GGI03_000887 [Coemansia sp. RSA 2337]|nr:hypothetical protein H4S03_000968 [Coemansia sp. S3946]KAJ2053346.1 hypothetical protein H4S04_000734 [Coemansia sp. S16]KAJ2069735.1 hypothetical protein GGI08_000199 [Coemansia sp. S2]KAJ2075956.1 hypothetical protein GGH13_000242 [Coemansia sp. S155-1]KAJ2118166.1 hypothetical protein IW146_000137 [Coemansia sp. RSA 922]KAJ2351030.1 hypothetical protein GGH92_002055 [Coemansia sp. RSA 2673]KAJ2468607.1 hypothetical protein GGI03_000887 [Coemansia sp. RSA 2337]